MLIALLPIGCGAAMVPEVSLPPRPPGAPTGSEFARRVTALSLTEREQMLRAEVARGNVPTFWRHFVEVKVARTNEGRIHTILFSVSPDYLAVGADHDYFLMPVTPSTAQAIADSLGCVLPTRRLVEDIYAAAVVKLTPRPLPPGAAMTEVIMFQQHNEMIHRQRAAFFPTYPLGALVAGHKKDVVLSPQLASRPDAVAIYGWHQTNGRPIQPLYTGHSARWVDYSHGARFLRRDLEVDGQTRAFEAVMADPNLAPLLSDEGPIRTPRYVSSPDIPVSFKETNTILNLAPDVRVAINSPAATAFNTNRPVRLVLYALANGSTIEQTIGRQRRLNDDPRFDGQHIGAQTRWLRERTRDANLVVAYLECGSKSWPAWRRQHDPDDRHIPALVDRLRRHFAPSDVKLVLTGHSGGGSFIFGLLNGEDFIPDQVERIAWLDSNYAYDAAKGHADKLVRWLAASPRRYLTVLAYDDSAALLEGKPIVSAAGGTWGRSHAMQRDLARWFNFARDEDADWERYRALDGRVQFWLKKNPTHAILHTKQVEWNGFIHALLTGTEGELQGYRYFGSRVYEQWIAE